MIKKVFNTAIAGAKGAATGHGSAVGLVKIAGMAGAAGAGALVAPLTLSTAVYMAFKAWFSKKNIKLLPVYKEFVEYATELYFASRFEYPLGRSFKHSSQFEDKKSIQLQDSSDDKIILFYYHGSWLIGDNNDWFITEKAIHFPSESITINFHDIQEIYSKYGKLIIVTLDGETLRLPSKFIDSESVAKFLTASVAALPLREKDLKQSFLSKVKDCFQMVLGGSFLTAAVFYFSEEAAAWVFIVTMLVAVFQLTEWSNKKKQ